MSKANPKEIALLKRRIKDHYKGNAAEFCRDLGIIHHTAVYDFLRGTRGPNPDLRLVLDALSKGLSPARVKPSKRARASASRPTARKPAMTKRPAAASVRV